MADRNLTEKWWPATRHPSFPPVGDPASASQGPGQRIRSLGRAASRRALRLPLKTPEKQPENRGRMSGYGCL